MLPIIILSIIYISSSAIEYQKISKYSSSRVKPDTRVYIDISSFKTGELIKLELSMDQAMNLGNKNSYTFYIGQKYATDIKYDYYWQNLTKVVNKNYTSSSFSYYYYPWNEIKQAGTNYVLIIPPAPFDSFYTSHNEKIKVNHLGGLSAGAIVGIVFGCVGGVVLLIVLIIKCCNSPQKPDYADNNPQAPLTTVQPIIPTVVQPVTPVVQPIIPVQPIVQVQPMVPTYGPPPPQPYVHNVY